MDTLLPMMFLGLCKLGTLLQTQNVSEQNQKRFLCPDTKFVSATNVAHAGKRGNICVGKNVSATICPCLSGPLYHINPILLYVCSV